MGRETKILLGMLGLLSGVFFGLLSMKLLVPRPPAGAGPDVRVEEFAAREIVDPPTPTPRPWDFTAAPPLVAAGVAPEAPAEPPDPPLEPPRFASRFSRSPAPAVAALPVDAPAPSTLDMPAPPAAPLDEPPTAPADRGFGRTDTAVTSAAWEPPAVPDAASQPLDVAATVPTGDHVVTPGESWWSLAERAYGDGRLYRALFAWNRSRDARVSLAPGTRLEIPPRDRLTSAWPRLIPAGSP